jgi:hypothetical protein
MIIGFLFATLFLFTFNLILQISSCSKEIKLDGRISGVSMLTSILTLILITWNIFAIIISFN